MYSFFYICSLALFPSYLLLYPFSSIPLLAFLSSYFFLYCSLGIALYVPSFFITLRVSFSCIIHVLYLFHSAFSNQSFPFILFLSALSYQPFSINISSLYFFFYFSLYIPLLHTYSGTQSTKSHMGRAAGGPGKSPLFPSHCMLRPY